MKPAKKTPSAQEIYQELYRELQSLGQIFPKTCNTCGRTFASLEEFLQQTTEVFDSTGLLEISPKSESVGLMRNCSCQSTLMVECLNRRDNSERGRKRREVFGRLFAMLTASGMDKREARATLRDALNGKTSP